MKGMRIASGARFQIPDSMVSGCYSMPILVELDMRRHVDSLARNQQSPAMNRVLDKCALASAKKLSLSFMPKILYYVR